MYIVAAMVQKAKIDGTFNITTFFVAVIFIVTAVKMSKSAAGQAGTAVLGLAGAAAGFATGAVVGGATAAATGGKAGGILPGAMAGMKKGGFSGGLTGGAQAGYKAGEGNAVTSAIGRTMERIGLRRQGTTATLNNQRVEEKAKLLANEYAAAKATGDTGTIDRIRKDARTAKGVRGAAAMKVVAGAKDLHKTFVDPATGGVNLAAASARLSYAESVGAKDIIKEQEKLMPGLKVNNDVAVGEEWQKKNTATGALIYPQTTAGRNAAAREVLRKQHAGMTVSDMRNLPDSQMGLEFVNDSNYGTFSRAHMEFTTEQKDKLKTLLPNLRSQTLSGLGLPTTAGVRQVRSAIAALKASPNLADREKAKRMEESANKYLLIKD
jgi:hypothetical protein